MESSGCVGSSIKMSDKNNGISLCLEIEGNGYEEGYGYCISMWEGNMDYEDGGYKLGVLEKCCELSLSVEESV